MNRNNLLIIAAVMVLSLGAYFYFKQAPEPSTQGSPLVAVTVPELSTAAKVGEAAYNENCASCHGRNGAGQDGVAPPFVHRIYEPNHHGDQAFFLAAQNGVRAHHWPFGNMPPVEGITQGEVASIVTYVRELQRANGI
ncbi:cytochrome c [Afifella sp. IM 167]|uniref:c-type cytochrome n=1 Tax=Afifella sp. IM 167 TaxID=2033586 RepID=UPI001CCB28D6|nr:cytochrome c [Afifella sp. IM 167]MBZ8134072.1 cytochrome C [Afifella sp. IM 167]